MRRITYRITYREGDRELVEVSARSINSGFSKAIKRSREKLGNGREREVAIVELWEVS